MVNIGGQWIEDAGGNQIWSDQPRLLREKDADVPMHERLSEMALASLEERKKFEGFWATVDENYRQSRFEGRGAPRDMLDQVYPGRAYRFVHTIESSVFSNNVKMYLEGYNPSLPDEVVRILEDVLNAEWRVENRLTRETRRAIRNAVKYGLGISLTSYEAKFEEDKKPRRRGPAEEILDAAEAEVAAQMAALPEEPRRVTYEMDARVRKEEICTRSISPWHFFIDPDATSTDDARWMGRIIFASLDAVQADKNLSNTKTLTASSRDRMHTLIGIPGKERSSQMTEHQKVILYEIFEQQTDGTWDMYVIADGQPDAGILRHEKAPYWCGHPYTVLQWNDDGDCFYPQSDILSVFTEILAERLLLTKALDGYSREQEDTVLYDSSLGITRESFQEIVAPDLSKWIKINTPASVNTPLGHRIYKVPKDAKSLEPLNFLAMLERSIQQNSGVSPNQLGQALKSGTTATEASSIATYASASQAHKQAGVEHFLSSLGLKRLALMAQFYSSERIARKAGAKAAEAWAAVDWNEAMVLSGFEVCVKPGSTRPVNDDVRAQRLMAVANLAGQNPVLAVIVNQVELYMEIFRAIGFHEGSRIFLETDPEKVAEAQALMAVGQMGGQRGSSPKPPAAPSGEAGAAQL